MANIMETIERLEKERDATTPGEWKKIHHTDFQMELSVYTVEGKAPEVLLDDECDFVVTGEAEDTFIITAANTIKPLAQALREFREWLEYKKEQAYGWLNEADSQDAVIRNSSYALSYIEALDKFNSIQVGEGK